MGTKNYIDMLKKKSQAPVYVAMRQALSYYLFENKVPGTIITRVMRRSRSNIYFSINQAKNMLEVGDSIMRQAYDEISCHKIRVVPCTVDGDVLSRHIGYKLLIDNVIY